MSGTTSLTSCSFDGEDEQIGSFISQNGGSISVSESTFSNLKMKSSFVAGGGNMVLKGNSFSSLVDSTESGSANVMGVTIGAEQKLEITKTDTKPSDFVSCSSKGNGGALNVVLKSTGVLVISHTSFQSCSSAGNGDCFFIDISESTMNVESPYSLSELTFKRTSQQNQELTNHQSVFFAVLEDTATTVLLSARSSLIAADPYDTIAFNETERNTIGFGEKKDNTIKVVGSLLYAFYPQTDGLHIHAEKGHDHELCGNGKLPCQSLAEGFDRVRGGLDGVGKIMMDAEMILSETLASVNKNIILTTDSSQSLLLDSQGSLDVSTGSLTFTSIVISLPSTNIAVTPFAVSGGALRFDPSSRLSHSGTITTPTTLTCPLMKVTSGSLAIEGSLSHPHSFSFFKNTASSECCLIQVGGDPDSLPFLTITHSHFTSCSNPNGAVLCFVGSRMGTVTMTSCYFNLNKGSTSNDILASEEWRQAFTTDTIQECYSDSDCNHLLIGQSSENDLVPFSVLGVDSLNANDDNCRLPDVSCSSVEKALSLCEQKETEEKYALRLIEMKSATTESTTLSVDSRRIILSASVDTITLEWSGTGSLMTITNGSVSLNSFKLVDSVQSSPTPLIVLSDSGSLSLTFITFEGSSTCKHSIIETHAGLLSVSTSQFSRLQQSGHALFETTSVVAIEKCQFMYITQESQGATVLSATVSDSASVSVLETSFSGCTASDSEHWITLKGRDQTTFLPTSWTGTFNKSSPWSGVVVDDSTKPIDEEFKPYSLLYEFFPSSETTVCVSSTTGNVDHPLCGHSQLACRSIDIGRALTSIDTIEVVSVGEIGGVLSVGNSTVALSGHNGRGRMIVLPSGRFVSDDEDDPGQLTISKLEIDISSSTLTDLSLFFIKTGTMDVSSCSIISTQAIPFCLIESTAESLNLLNITFRVDTTSSGTLLKSLKGNVKMEEITISSITLTSTAFSIANSSSVSLSKIDFTSPETSASSVSELISTSNVSSFTLSQSDFVGSTASQNEDEDTSCEWSSGLLSLTDTIGIITGTRFSSLRQGGLLMTTSNITLSGCTFTLNTPLSTPSESFRRNVRCVGHSALEIESVHAGDGQDTPAHWISNDEDCSVTRQKKSFSAPLFIPTLDTSSTKCTFTKKTQTFALTLAGTMLIPCGLLLQIYEHGVKEPKNIELDLSTLGGEWTGEKTITLSLGMSAISLNETHEWRARLVYGCGEQTESFLQDKRVLLNTASTSKWAGR
ncbi:hypothetical protein BLNAU_23390 [Blattamonas nauphoetae]|uniref:Uncharacterized protein n=1 Tax=Blattamonas nauphoetae TaxID=2049346 RepID=A0ABQ9WQE3_9EUKA|nr:hypothetical protein BLNAU_23390 [Blattamonas nauphoetae]